MNQSRWQRVEELFHAALEREPSARDAFLTEACNGDSELRREIFPLRPRTSRSHASEYPSTSASHRPHRHSLTCIYQKYISCVSSKVNL